MTWLRALAAAGLSVFLPGAGHALLRDWVRALLFAGLFVSALYVFLPTQQLSAAGSMAAAMDVATAELSRIDRFVLSFIVVFAAVDAGFRAMGFSSSATGDGDGASCPYCGKELDEDLEFCHWCTEPLVPEADPEAEEDAL
ncbi:zinc ribbon domain-containing protein [Natronobeatus ordinarius]|uniref:zinc ribbon domain-containing protein n=1 Tax=Natronobeatus ordinarius TaxID=2963433 RepID=UPI0020CF5D92|nr:zinc ribbon domain-containing protein [Natronobeatus ordinarius]